MDQNGSDGYRQEHEAGERRPQSELRWASGFAGSPTRGSAAVSGGATVRPNARSVIQETSLRARSTGCGWKDFCSDDSS
jgi:hypothetical protein